MRIIPGSQRVTTTCKAIPPSCHLLQLRPMYAETRSDHTHRHPSPDRYRLGPNPSPPPGPARKRSVTRRKLTGADYLKNILNSDSEPEQVEPSSSKNPRHRRAGSPDPESHPPPQNEDAADYLRRQLCLLPSIPVDLWAIADPPEGQKPFASLPTLVKLAIHGSPQKRLTLQGICDALIARFSWFHEHRQDDAWKNSVRHNLSLNKVFRKIPRDVTQLGKGCYWELDLSGGEGHKRPRKRRKFEKCAGSDHDGSESVESADPEGAHPFKEEHTPDPDSLVLVQPYSSPGGSARRRVG
ncbi:fork head domain-containing protein [Mycena epipterygia]|nr:fork head domain-containing protein [Mycena epipterygia]